MRTASFIELTICRPKSHGLPLSEVREFTKKTIALAPEAVQFGVEVRDSEPQQDAITVRMLAVQWSD